MAEGKDLLDISWIEEAQEGLTEMFIDLDEDPIAGGIRRIVGKTAQARNMITAVQRAISTTMIKRMEVNRAYQLLKSRFEMLVNQQLVTEPEMQKFKNVTERKALAHMKLKDDWDNLSQHEMTVAIIDDFLSLLKTKSQDLKDIQMRLRDQYKMCSDESQSLGIRWGGGSGKLLGEMEGIEGVPIEDIVPQDPKEKELPWLKVDKNGNGDKTIEDVLGPIPKSEGLEDLLSGEVDDEEDEEDEAPTRILDQSVHHFSNKKAERWTGDLDEDEDEEVDKLLGNVEIPDSDSEDEIGVDLSSLVDSFDLEDL